MHTQIHYQKIAAEYHQHWFYQPDSKYEKMILEHILKRLQITDTDRVCDLAGGSGRFAHLIWKTANLVHPVVCVDTCPTIYSYPGVEYVECDLLQQDLQSFSKILIKEAIHHISLNDIKKIKFAPHSRLLILTRPSKPNYPFSPRMYTIWRENQLETQQYVNILKHMGLTVDSETTQFSVKMTLTQWLEMIRKRMWSCFSNTYFTDLQLENEIEIIKTLYPKPIVYFEEQLVWITAFKK